MCAGSNPAGAPSKTAGQAHFENRASPLFLFGDSGTGKSRLLIAPSAAAAEAGYRVLSILASKLVNGPVDAADDKHLSETSNRYSRADLLCLDELGAIELDRRGAEVCSRPHRTGGRSVVAIASNKLFAGSAKTFTDLRLCAAIVDRLTFAGQIIESGSTSYRLAHAQRANPPTDG